jgi:hypothetical protein
MDPKQEGHKTTRFAVETKYFHAGFSEVPGRLPFRQELHNLVAADGDVVTSRLQTLQTICITFTPLC